MRRRDFVALLGSVAAWPLGARAQQSTTPAIGWLSSAFPPPPHWTAAFNEGLKSFGYIVDKNVTIEYRRAEGQYERLPALAAELVARQVAVIVAENAGVAPLAARAATTTIPIVFLVGADPVRTGLVASLDRPGGNTTGVSQLGYALTVKRNALMPELLPQAKVLARLSNPRNPTHPGKTLIGGEETYHARTGIRLVPLTASTEDEIEPAIASAAEQQAEGLTVYTDSFFYGVRDQLVASLTRHRMPASFPDKESVAAGGLMSLGVDDIDAHHLLGTYVGRVLKGEKPAELPVAIPKVDLVINMRTAKAFGLAVPDSLRAKATELIE
jgi:putative ABC transport system substrate-binding protein